MGQTQQSLCADANKEVPDVQRIAHIWVMLGRDLLAPELSHGQGEEHFTESLRLEKPLRSSPACDQIQLNHGPESCP